MIFIRVHVNIMPNIIEIMNIINEKCVYYDNNSYLRTTWFYDNTKSIYDFVRLALKSNICPLLSLNICK